MTSDITGGFVWFSDTGDLDVRSGVDVADSTGASVLDVVLFLSLRDCKTCLLSSRNRLIASLVFFVLDLLSCESVCLTEVVVTTERGP